MKAIMLIFLIIFGLSIAGQDTTRKPKLERTDSILQVARNTLNAALNAYTEGLSNTKDYVKQCNARTNSGYVTGSTGYFRRSSGSNINIRILI